MSAADSKAAVDRLAAKRAEHGPEGFAAYAFLVLGILGYQTPEVLMFLLDQADRSLAEDGAL
jgi:hypothetical protein